jgi:hypothetical protein
MVEIYPHFPLPLHGGVHRDNFTFRFIMNLAGCLLMQSFLQDCCLQTKEIQKRHRHISKLAVEFEVSIAMSGQAKIFLALDRTASVIELNAVGLIYF